MSRLRQGFGAQGTPVVPVISRRVVMASLVAIAALAAAPFLVAVAVSDRRVAAAETQASAIAAVLGNTGTEPGAGVAMLIGTGNVPRFGQDVGWPTTEGKADLRLGSGSATAPPDPWRNAYVVNIGARGAVWVVSAGPNGILETPFEGVGELQGDDIGARVGGAP